MSRRSELPLRVLIVDDEALARERTRRLLAKLGGVEVVAECDNGRDALALIERDPPDAVLLDINMPELDGMRVIEALDDPPAIILATAYEDHAVRAFELEVTDYLLKPFSADRLKRALAKVRRQLGADDSAGHEVGAQVKIPADTGSGVELIPAEKLSAARIEEGVVFLFRNDGETFYFSGTLQELEVSLQGSMFMRASRSAIINAQAVLRFHVCDDGGLKLELQGGYEERVSRRRARFFRARMGLKIKIVPIPHVESCQDNYQ